MASFSPTLRNYREEDFPGLLNLYDSAVTGNWHFARDKDFLRYFLHCSYDDENNIFVALENEEITGLAIIFITIEEGELKQGNITELQAKDTSSMQALIQAAVAYCHEKDVDIIAVAPPPSPAIEEVFRDWLKSQTGVMMGKLLSPLPLLQALLDNQWTKSSFDGRNVVFSIGEEIIEAVITPEMIAVTQLDKEPDNSAIFVAISPEVLFKIALGTISPYMACLTRKIKTRGLKNVPSILKLFQLTRLPQPWHVTLGDRM